MSKEVKPISDSSSKLNLDEDARRALAQCYALLIRLADEKAAGQQGPGQGTTAADGPGRCR